MTTLIIVVSATNIAIGYGLAIYLGHARVVDKSAKESHIVVSTTEVAEARTAFEQEMLDSVEKLTREFREQVMAQLANTGSSASKSTTEDKLN